MQAGRDRLLRPIVVPPWGLDYARQEKLFRNRDVFEDYLERLVSRGTPFERFKRRIRGVSLDPESRDWLKKMLIAHAYAVGDEVLAGGVTAGNAAWTTSTSGGAIALSAATAKTILNVIAATTAIPKIVELYVGFDGTTSSAAPVLIDQCNSTQAGAGTNTAFTPVQCRGGSTLAAQCTAAVNYTAEPTTLTVAKQWLADPSKGGMILQFPLGREAHGTPAAASAMKGLPIRLTAPATVNVRAYVDHEE